MVASRPLVSAVIPAYNCASYLGRAVDSVLEQDYSNVECIVVNDGSTDETAAVARAYGSSIQLVEQSNAGASAARNAGIARARGEFIAFLDADDYWHKSKLGKQVRVMQDHPDVVLVTCNFVDHVEDAHNAALSEQAASRPYDGSDVTVYDGFLPLFQDPYLGTPTVMVRTSRVCQVGGFDTALTIAEDLDFYFRICLRRRYARVEQPLTFIHRRPATLSSTTSGYRCNLEVIDRVERDYPEFADAHPGEFRKHRHRLYSHWAARMIMRGEGIEARSILRESRKHGRIPAYHRLYLKSYFASSIRLVKGFRLPHAKGRGRYA